MKLNEYEIFTHNDLEERIKSNLPSHLREIFDKKLGYFAKNPFHPSLNTKKYDTCKKTLKRLGVDEVWQFYINRKDYRCIFYTIHSEEKIIIADIGNHQQLEKKYS